MPGTRWVVWLLVCGGLGCNSEAGIRADELPNPADSSPRDPEPTIQVDRVLQVVEPVVDVLWVLDNSTSMDDDREALADAFPRFIQPFEDAGSDWHVGVITTDMETKGHMGRLREVGGDRWLHRDMKADIGATFLTMATQSINAEQVTAEFGREAVKTALYDESQKGGFNEGFLRRESTAYLHITVVSDEDDDTPEDQNLPLDAFIELLQLLKPLDSRLTFNSIVALQDLGADGERGQAYIDVSEAVGGVVKSIFDKEGWDTLMDQLSGIQAPAPVGEFFLSRLPVPETIEVAAETLDGVTFVFVQDVDFVYNQTRNSVQFVDEPPPLGSSLEITYTVRAAPGVVLSEDGL